MAQNTGIMVALLYTSDEKHAKQYAEDFKAFYNLLTAYNEVKQIQGNEIVKAHFTFVNLEEYDEEPMKREKLEIFKLEDGEQRFVKYFFEEQDVQNKSKGT